VATEQPAPPEPVLVAEPTAEELATPVGEMLLPPAPTAEPQPVAGLDLSVPLLPPPEHDLDIPSAEMITGPSLEAPAAPRPRPTAPRIPLLPAAVIVLLGIAVGTAWRLWRTPATAKDSASPVAHPSSPPAARTDSSAAAAPSTAAPPTPPAPGAASPEILINHYGAAKDSVRADFDTALARIHFGRLLTDERLGALDSLRVGHQTIATAVGVLGAYRAKSAAIERAYQDSADALSQRHAWSVSDLEKWRGRPTSVEAPDQARLTDSLLSNVDGIYEVLIDQAGKYDFTPASIAFADPAGLQRYGSLRSSLSRRVPALAGIPASKLSLPLARVLVAIGSPNLPAGFAKEPIIPVAPDLPKDSGN
jgi:hypothetical protein